MGAIIGIILLGSVIGWGVGRGLDAAMPSHPAPVAIEQAPHAEAKDAAQH